MTHDVSIIEARAAAGLAVLLVGLLAVEPQTAHALARVVPYEIRAGDRLSVSVWKEEELQDEVVVRPDAGLTFPRILRRAANGQVPLNFSYQAVFRGRSLDQDVLLQEGDVVVVP